MKLKMEHRFTLTNWTFGVWWTGRRTKLTLRYPAFGLDLGPLEVIIWKVSA